MPQVEVLNQVTLKRTPRVIQLEGMFDIPAQKVNTFELAAELPLEENPWNIGLVVGPSGTGKTSLIKELWPENIVTGYRWKKDESVVDNFPKKLPVKKIVALLSSVGFSSPPAWLKPFRCLSNGEQFRVTLARALAECQANNQGPVVFDEFTSVVDRTVAQVGSAAVAKSVRKQKGQFVAVTCHEDVEEWMQPDWVFRTDQNEFTWRWVLPRPQVELVVTPCERKVWELFRRHHYLSDTLSTICKCYLGTIDGKPATFTAVVSFPHPKKPGWREHRTVCLPDFQGVGIGNAMSELLAAVYSCTGKPYRSTTSHPAMIAHRTRSPNWRMFREKSLGGKQTGGTLSVIGARKDWPAWKRLALMNQSAALTRATASFEYIGPKLKEQARSLGVIA